MLSSRYRSFSYSGLEGVLWAKVCLPTQFSTSGFQGQAEKVIESLKPLKQPPVRFVRKRFLGKSRMASFWKGDYMSFSLNS